MCSPKTSHHPQQITHQQHVQPRHDTSPKTGKSSTAAITAAVTSTSRSAHYHEPRPTQQRQQQHPRPTPTAEPITVRTMTTEEPASMTTAKETTKPWTNEEPISLGVIVANNHNDDLLRITPTIGLLESNLKHTPMRAKLRPQNHCKSKSQTMPVESNLKHTPMREKLTSQNHCKSKSQTMPVESNLKHTLTQVHKKNTPTREKLKSQNHCKNKISNCSCRIQHLKHINSSS
ncbi:uncharacterized protein ACN427_013058 [Glossina fuscipes fuscipes]